MFSALRKATWAARFLAMWPFLGGGSFPSYIGPTTFLLGTKGLKLGRRVRIFPGLRAEVHGDGSIHIGDDVTIGQDFHVTAINDLRIGSGCTISGNVMVTDIDHEYRLIGTPVHRQPLLGSSTIVGDNCFIGMGARIQAGTVLGEGCVVGANAVVRGEFPPYSVVVGVPAKVVKYMDPASGEWVRPVAE